MKILRKIVGIISLLVIIGASIAILSMPPGDELSIGGIILIFYVGFSMIAGLATSFFFLMHLVFRRSSLRSRAGRSALFIVALIIAFAGFARGSQVIMISVVIVCFLINLYLAYWGLLKKQ